MDERREIFTGSVTLSNRRSRASQKALNGRSGGRLWPQSACGPTNRPDTTKPLFSSTWPASDAAKARFPTPRAPLIISNGFDNGKAESHHARNNATSRCRPYRVQLIVARCSVFTCIVRLFTGFGIHAGIARHVTRSVTSFRHVIRLVTDVRDLNAKK
jgi:hypothetical protein